MKERWRHKQDWAEVAGLEEEGNHEPGNAGPPVGVEKVRKQIPPRAAGRNSPAGTLVSALGEWSQTCVLEMEQSRFTLSQVSRWQFKP